MRRIETHMLAGPAGKLEALLEEPEDREPVEAALVCHPHPLYGGTMHNKVVYRMARGLRRTGAVVLRFNFRGVNLSEGEHAHGVGEVEDARSALAWLRERYPALPFTIAGFSFGSRVALQLGCEVGARRVIAVGFPTRMPHPDLAACSVPKIFVQSTHDEHGPVDQLKAALERIGEPKQLHLVEARDHFFMDNLDGLESVIQSL